MTAQAPQPDAAQLQGLVQSLSRLQMLVMQSGNQPDLPGLQFTILNETARIAGYDRAALFTPDGSKCMGVSGSSKPDLQSTLVSDWKALLAGVTLPEETTCLTAEMVEDAALLQHSQAQNNGTSFALMPIRYKGELLALLLLERWQERPWQEGELALLKAAANQYGLFWFWIGSRKPGFLALAKERLGRKTLIIMGIILLCLMVIPVPLRIVAPCEITAKNPVSITAKIDGVIQRIEVQPGQHVEQGMVLARYEESILREELEAAKQQVATTHKALLRAQAESFKNPQARGELAILRAQLEKEKARLALAAYRSEQAVIRAPQAGTVLLDDPHAWEGRPVRIGERLMLLVDPGKSKAKIFLPVDDDITFPENATVRVMPQAQSLRTFTGTLRYVSDHAEMTPEGTPCFVAEAEWETTPQGARIGMRGTAILYGRWVPLGYWLLRKPIATVRTRVGY